MKNVQKKSKSHLDKTFLEELSHKIWSTKGSRFNANSRLLETAKLSNLCSNLLSVYIIAAGLLSVYNVYEESSINEDTIAYSITCLSILLLVFRQIENAKKFEVRAMEYHKCGLELSRVYNELRINKTLDPNQSSDTVEIVNKLSNDYQKILEKYSNHRIIDFDMFRIGHKDYYELNFFDEVYVRIKYFIKINLIYYILIILPIIVISTIYFKK